jgi:DNA-binding MarR family transcriptional regulator
MMLASQGPLNLNTVARGLAVHSSNATRACDSLVASGLLDQGLGIVRLFGVSTRRHAGDEVVGRTRQHE